MTHLPTPSRIEWIGPERWLVWADEDGTHIRTPKGDALEHPDVERLLTLWQEVRRAVRDENVPSPRPPSREEIRVESVQRQEEWMKRRIFRAIENEIDPPNTPGF